MGDIRKLRKKYERPRKPWEKGRIIQESKLIKSYGYKNKKELWKFRALLRGFRAQARNIVASDTEQARKEGENLINKLVNLGLLDEGDAFDDVLELTIDDISKRRLVPMVVKKGLARTPKQARQFITHKHIIVNDKKVSSPNYIVSKKEENGINFAPNSVLRSRDHPLREAMNNPRGNVKKEKEEDKEGEDDGKA